MYINGVSTRRVSEIVEKLCGAEISSTQVSKAAQLAFLELPGTDVSFICNRTLKRMYQKWESEKKWPGIFE